MLRDALKFLRTFNDCTQKALSERLDISTSALYYIENGSRSIPIGLVERYSEIFGISTGDIELLGKHLPLGMDKMSGLLRHLTAYLESEKRSSIQEKETLT